MQAQRVTPEALIAKRVEAKNLLTPTEELAAGVLDDLVERPGSRKADDWLRAESPRKAQRQRGHE